MCTKDGNSGFSLIELMVVATIAVVLAVAAVYSLSGIRAERNRVAAETLMMHLRYARDVAVSREKNMKIVFSVPSNSYSISIEDTNAPGGYAFANDPATQTDLVVDISQSYPGVALSAVNNNMVIFSKTNGVPYDISGLPLSSTGTISFSSGSTVTIAPRTGYVGTQ